MLDANVYRWSLNEVSDRFIYRSQTTILWSKAIYVGWFYVLDHFTVVIYLLCLFRILGWIHVMTWPNYVYGNMRESIYEVYWRLQTCSLRILFYWFFSWVHKRYNDRVIDRVLGLYCLITVRFDHCEFFFPSGMFWFKFLGYSCVFLFTSSS